MISTYASTLSKDHKVGVVHVNISALARMAPQLPQECHRPQSCHVAVPFLLYPFSVGSCIIYTGHAKANIQIYEAALCP